MKWGATLFGAPRQRIGIRALSLLCGDCLGVAEDVDRAGHALCDSHRFMRAASNSPASSGKGRWFPPDTMWSLGPHSDPARVAGGSFPRGAEGDERMRGLALSDGGVCDNLGLETVWKDPAVVRSSDEGALFGTGSDTGLVWG